MLVSLQKIDAYIIMHVVRGKRKNTFIIFTYGGTIALLYSTK